MKKILLFFWFVLGFSALSAQDTILMFDTFYLHQSIVGDIDTNIECEKDSVLLYDELNPFIQIYEISRPTTIYGVALAPINVSNTGLNAVNWDCPHPDIVLTAVVYEKIAPGTYIKVNSIVCDTTPYRCCIRYQSPNAHPVYCSAEEIREFYFNQPCVVSDSCLVGIQTVYLTGSAGWENIPLVKVAGMWSNTTSYLWNYNSYWPNEYNDCDEFHLGNYSSGSDSCNYSLRLTNQWGGTWPIVGFHCKTAPEGFRTLGTGGGYCDLAWNRMSGGTYEVAVGHWGESPDTVSRRYLTTDTTIRIDSLEPGTLYQAWVRGQCRYATVSYDTSLWSPWSIRMPIMVTTGIQQAEGPHFTLTPNPASGTVTVGGFEGEGSVEIVDMAGRVSGQWPVAGGQRTIDVSRLPAGSYVVRLTTAEGTASRMLQVE